MADPSIKVLNFDRGIEQIMRSRGFEDTSLPQGTALTPSDQGVRPQLDDVLRAPSVDDALDGFLRPPIHDMEILRPPRYAALIHEAHDTLRQRAESEGGRPELNEAADLLENEIELRTLLQSYRQSLLGA